MNREDIIRMAREAGSSNAYDAEFCFGEYELMYFAQMIAEDCAGWCEEKAGFYDRGSRPERAFGADACAAAIREAYKP